MPIILHTGDQVIIVTKEFKVQRLEIIDIDMRREGRESLSAIYWLSDGRAYQRTDLFINVEEARRYYQAIYKDFLLNFDS